MLFVNSYIVVVVWILLQVSVAVLLVRRARPSLHRHVADGPSIFGLAPALLATVDRTNLLLRPLLHKQEGRNSLVPRAMPERIRRACDIIIIIMLVY